VLQEIAALVRNNIRRTDFAFRYGGEEIAILMPETALEDAADAMETLRTRIAGHPFRSLAGETISLTCSFGVTASEDGGNIEPGSLITQADKALYASKRHGRNMVSRALVPEAQDPSRAST
jgi:diguanylate cyclase